jgi:hypothetical protein
MPCAPTLQRATCGRSYHPAGNANALKLSAGLCVWSKCACSSHTGLRQCFRRTADGRLVMCCRAELWWSMRLAGQAGKGSIGQSSCRCGPLGHCLLAMSFLRRVRQSCFRSSLAVCLKPHSTSRAAVATPSQCCVWISAWNSCARCHPHRHRWRTWPGTGCSILADGLCLTHFVHMLGCS